MRDYKSLSHSRWDCKYHVVFIPKKRQKMIYGAIRKHLGSTLHELAKRKGVTIRRGALDERSCSYVYQRSAKVFCI
ncbi:Transposase IS200 like protein [Vibrio aquimaris]|uniref:Transposase IS200 like protein n=2 Tax=Vibrio aquimaris TaxID=2587862 RepID=A0A5P9CL69_9VIBR|nr:Transposase IS200 like protein [Vibrio aquimaris]